MRINKIIFLIFMLTLLCGCNLKNIEENDRKQEKKNEIEAAYKQFVNRFSKDYPDFKLIDLQKGTSENYPILLVAVGENKNDQTSSTLFIVDDDGVGEVMLASDNKGLYRKEEGIVLDKNVILISLNVIDSNQNEEIHDFKITVTKQNNQESSNTLYSSEETIRNK